MNFVYSIIFLIELLMKVISEGLIWDKTSYLRNSWNVLDFTVVAVSLVEALLEINRYTSDTTNKSD